MKLRIRVWDVTTAASRECMLWGFHYHRRQLVFEATDTRLQHCRQMSSTLKQKWIFKFCNRSGLDSDVTLTSHNTSDPIFIGLGLRKCLNEIIGEIKMEK